MRKKIIFWMVIFFTSFLFVGYPPQTGIGQSTPIKDSTVLQKIQVVQQQIQTLKDSIRQDVATIKQCTPPTKKRARTVYKTKIKKVEIPVYVPVRDTVFIPVDKSEYYLKSKKVSDSLALQEHIQDSIAAERAYELKHRSIFKKIFGSKVK